MKKKGGKLKWVIIVIVIIAVIAAVSGGDDKPQKVGDSNEGNSSSEKSDAEEQPNGEEGEEGEGEETVFKKGEIAELNGVQVTLTDYKESAGGEYNKPADGNVFLLAEFEIANNTEEEMSVSSMLSFDAYADDYSLDYSISAMMDKDGSQLDGTIAAGKKMKGWIGWEVPADYKNVEIHFTDNVWSGNKFVFVIEK